MKQLTQWMALPILAAALLLAPTHTALAQDSTSSPDAKDVAAKTGKDVAKGTKTAADKTADGSKTVATKTAKGTKVAAKDTAHGTKVAADKTASGAKKVFHGASSKTGKADDSTSSKPPSQ